MTSDDEHSELMVAWTSVHGLLDRMTSSLNWTDVQYLDVTEMADRGRGLASHLQGAVTLSRDFRYDSGFALVRTALEQVVWTGWSSSVERTFNALPTSTTPRGRNGNQTEQMEPIGRRPLWTGTGRKRAMFESSVLAWIPSRIAAERLGA